MSKGKERWGLSTPRLAHTGPCRSTLPPRRPQAPVSHAAGLPSCSAPRNPAFGAMWPGPVLGRKETQTEEGCQGREGQAEGAGRGPREALGAGGRGSPGWTALCCTRRAQGPQVSQARGPSRGAGTGLKGPEGRALTRPVGPEGSCALKLLSGPLSRTTSETWDTRSRAEPLMPSGRSPSGLITPTHREGNRGPDDEHPGKRVRASPWGPPTQPGDSPLWGGKPRPHRGSMRAALCQTLDTT